MKTHYVGTQKRNLELGGMRTSRVFSLQRHENRLPIPRRVIYQACESMPQKGLPLDLVRQSWCACTTQVQAVLLAPTRCVRKLSVQNTADSRSEETSQGDCRHGFSVWVLQTDVCTDDRQTDTDTATALAGKRTEHTPRRRFRSIVLS